MCSLMALHVVSSWCVAAAELRTGNKTKNIKQNLYFKQMTFAFKIFASLARHFNLIFMYSLFLFIYYYLFAVSKLQYILRKK